MRHPPCRSFDALHMLRRSADGHYTYEICGDRYDGFLPWINDGTQGRIINDKL